MEKTVLRIVSLALVAIMMFFAVGCDLMLEVEDLGDVTWPQGVNNSGITSGSQFGGGEATKPAEEKPTNEYDNVEESFTSSLSGCSGLDFDGDEVAILFRDYIHNSREWRKETIEDELDEAIAWRNETVQEDLNLKIVWQPVASNGNDYSEYTARFHDMVQTDVNSGRHYYDISANFGYPTTATAIRDYTTNLLDTSIFPYFNFELPCWNQAIVNNTTFNGRLHYVAGDINLSMFDASCVIWHNKTLYDYNKEANDPENLQQLALDGNWTYDELYRWAQVFYVDNGTTPDERDSGDTYALLAFVNDPMPRDVFPYAWDLKFVIEENDGTHSFNIVGNDKIDNALKKARNLLRAPGTYNSCSAVQFAAGKSLFLMERLYAGYDYNMAIREMEDKYGLLPVPKYDSTQEQYYTTAQDYYTLMFVLDHSDSKIATKGDEVSAFLQLATEESYTGVRGYYFNRIIKPKFFGTDDSEGTVTRSIALFDIIVANIKFDYCYIYSMQLNNINHLWRNALLADQNDSLEKLYLANKSNFESAIQTTDAWFGLG